METVQNIHHTYNIFTTDFIDSKSYYLHCFGELPGIVWIPDVDTTKLLAQIKTDYHDNIAAIYQHNEYEHDAGEFSFHMIIIRLKDNYLVELGKTYCLLLHPHTDNGFASTFTRIAAAFKLREKKKTFEINLIIKSGYGLDLRAMEIKKTRLNIGLFYADDFAAVDHTIRQRLNRRNDKGLVLLHGLPGTGKTTYLRYLVGKLKKRVMFLSPGAASCMTDPGFIELLINYPNTVVIIEDAENIITDRKVNGDSAVSNLLNISDGLLADCLNVQLICTFNSPLTMVDNALLRKGRLIAKYEFGKLPVAKAQRLSDHFGFSTNITKPMTLAEISHQHEQQFHAPQVAAIGFRRDEVMIN